MAKQGMQRCSEACRIARRSSFLWRTEEVVHRGVALVHGDAEEQVREMRKIKWTLKNKRGRGGASCTRHCHSYLSSDSSGCRGRARAA